MGIFDGGFDPLKGFQGIADAAGKAAADLPDVTAKATNGLAEKTREVAAAAGDAAGSLAGGVVRAADSAGMIVQKTAESVGDVISGAASGAKEAMNQRAEEKMVAEKAAYVPKIEEAKKSIEGTKAEEFIGLFSDSPLALTESNAGKVKSSFPVPREQTILWADAEFDLRPSGVAMTEKGVYIKTDAQAFSFPGKEQKQSCLFYIEWDYFDPASFLGDDDSNLAFGVDESCRGRFIEGCRDCVSSVAAGFAEVMTDVFDASNGLVDDGLKASAVVAAATLNGSDEVFVEQRAAIRNPSGHGELAEEANNILDRVHGHKAEILGRDLKKNGPDRMVDGVLIQTKYYGTARGSLESCFDSTTHQYRYIADDGSPMQLEVPKDQYRQVLEGFEEKIRQGRVPGVSDPEEAKNIVREGRLSYKQAVNLAKPGTVESLAYDALTGAVTCSCAFGLSFLTTSFVAYRETNDTNEAVQAGIVAGAQVFGLSFIQHMVVSQLSRTGVSDILMAPSQAIVGKLGFKTSASVVNGLRALAGKKAISGAAASKQLAKMLRSNVVTAAVTMAVFSIPETYKLVQGKASGAQYAQNIATLATSVAGGFAGAVAAGAAAAKIGGAVGTAVTPGIGTVVGIAGGMVGGTVGTLASSAIGGVFFEGDGAAFGRYFNAIVSSMAVEYLLDSEEMDKLLEILNGIKPSEFKKLMEETLSAEKQEERVREFLDPVFESVVSQRVRFLLPTNEQINKALSDLEKSIETED